jgi:hypothetical protein
MRHFFYGIEISPVPVVGTPPECDSCHKFAGTGAVNDLHHHYACRAAYEAWMQAGGSAKPGLAPTRHFFDGWEIDPVTTVGNVNERRCLSCNAAAERGRLEHFVVCTVAARSPHIRKPYVAAPPSLDFEDALKAHAKAAQLVGEVRVMLEDAKSDLDAATARLRALMFGKSAAEAK